MKEYEEKMEKLYNFIRVNRKFPEFAKINSELYTKICRIIKCWGHYIQKIFYLFFKQNYDKNMKIFLIQKKNYKGSNANLVFEYFEKALEYQKENLAWFTKADLFNNYSEAIFYYFNSLERTISTNFEINEDNGLNNIKTRQNNNPEEKKKILNVMSHTQINETSPIINSNYLVEEWLFENCLEHKLEENKKILNSEEYFRVKNPEFNNYKEEMKNNVKFKEIEKRQKFEENEKKFKEIERRKIFKENKSKSDILKGIKKEEKIKELEKEKERKEIQEKERSIWVKPFRNLK